MVWLPFIVITLVLFILGAVVGSFLNVVIYRTVTQESWVAGRSRCDSCHKQIAWYDNIPLLSFLLLKGQCRWCHSPISITHPVVEFMTGSLIVWWYWVGFIFFQLSSKPFQTIQPLFWLVVGVLLMVIFFADLWYYLIPDVAVTLLTALVVLYRVALVWFGVMQPIDFGWALIGTGLAALFLASLWAGTRGKGMGFGDVKLIVPLALLLGWPDILVGLLSSFVLGAAVGLVLVVSKQRRFGQIIPFGPFLIAGTGIGLVWGGQIIAWYLRLLQVS